MSNKPLFFGAITIYLVLLFLSSVLIPPLQKPDEPIHFLKTVTMVETYQLFCLKSGDNPSIPVELVELALGPQQVREGTTTNYPNPCSLPFIYYLPSAAFIIVLKLSHVSPWYFIYASRMINGLLFLSISLLSLRLAPKFAQRSIVLFMLLPIVGLQATAVSKDWAVFAFSILLFSLYTKVVSSKIVQPKLFGTLLFAYIGLVLARISYFPLVIPLIVSILNHTFSKRLQKRYVVSIILVTLLISVAIFWLWYLPKIEPLLIQPLTDGGVHPAYQLSNLLYTPLLFWHQLHTTVAHQLIPLYMSGIGSLGWNTTPLPDYVYVWFILGWVWIAILLRRDTYSVKTPGLLIGVTASFLMIMLSSYLFTTSITSTTIQGLQGRYFAPLIPFALLGLIKQTVKWWFYVFAAWGLLSLFSVISTIMQLF